MTTSIIQLHIETTWKFLSDITKLDKIQKLAINIFGLLGAVFWNKLTEFSMMFNDFRNNIRTIWFIKDLKDLHHGKGIINKSRSALSLCNDVILTITNIAKFVIFLGLDIIKPFKAYKSITSTICKINAIVINAISITELKENTNHMAINMTNGTSDHNDKIIARKKLLITKCSVDITKIVLSIIGIAIPILTTLMGTLVSVIDVYDITHKQEMLPSNFSSNNLHQCSTPISP